VKQEYWSIEQLRAYREKKLLKMHNVKTEVDGRLFDSQKEANYYCDLKIRKQIGEIIDFFCQVPFLVHEGYFQDGKWIKPIFYVADFLVIRRVLFDSKNPKTAGVIREIHETKGKWTRTAIDKRKMFERRYPEYRLVIV
jgi:hypothetical protein